MNKENVNSRVNFKASDSWAGSTLKIHELAEQTGLTAATIRYYEKEDLLDRRHVSRERNAYRDYTGDAIARLKLIKKLQSVGFSLGEIRETMNEQDLHALDDLRVIERIRKKIGEIERKRYECEQILETLGWMLEYRIALTNDPQKAESLLRLRYGEQAARSPDATVANS